MTIQANKQFVLRFIDVVLNAQDLGAVDDFVPPDFVEHVPLPGQGPGREGLRHAVGMLLEAFPDLRWRTEQQVAEGDTVVSRFTWTGTHRGEFLGVPATGRRVAVWGVVMDVVRDGLLVESRIIMDTLGLLQQLGVIPRG
jgi:steroid delta-isomerase-like uncharacterized protein